MILKVNYTLIAIQVLLTKTVGSRVFFGLGKRRQKSLNKPAFSCTQKTCCIVLKNVDRFYVIPEIRLPFSS